MKIDVVRLWMKAATIFAIAFVLYFLTRSPGLDEWDSVQFAMGVRGFDMWKHHPHPPGYPLFILFGWLADRLFGVGPILSLHFASAAGGAAFVAIWFLIIRSQFTERLAWWVAVSLVFTASVWMTATKVLTDTPAIAFLSAEILAAIYYRKRQNLVTLLATSLLGVIAVGVRPQLVLIALIVLATALKKSPAKKWFVALGSFVGGCLLWLVPTCYLQAQLNKAVPIWRVYFDLAYGQWTWRLDKPGAYLGAGDWSVGYLATRFANHILGWFGLGFGFWDSNGALVIGIVLSTVGLVAYIFWRREPSDAGFWKFHAPWACVHVAIIFICLPGSPRYYLIILPLLLVAILRGFFRLRAPWNFAALSFPLLLTCITLPLAVKNHRDEAPPTQLVHYLEKLYPPSNRGRVVLLFRSAKRHAEWYAPEFQNIDKIPTANELPEVTRDATAIYTDDAKLELPKGWHRVPVAEFKRSPVIYQKHHAMTLLLIEREDQS